MPSPRRAADPTATLAAAIHKISVEHLDRYFAWPVTLIVTGLVSMFASWIVPRWRAQRGLRQRR